MVVKKREHRKESGRKDEKINLILLSLVLSLIYGCSSFTSKTLDIAYLEEKVPAELLAYHLISTFDNDYIQDSPYDTKYSIILPTLQVKKRKNPLVERFFHYIYKICT